MSFTRLPVLPYPYAATLQHYIFTQQAYVTVDESQTVYQGIMACRGQERRIIGASTILSLSQFAFSKIVFEKVAAAAMKLDIITPHPPGPNPMRTKTEIVYYEHRLQMLLHRSRFQEVDIGLRDSRVNSSNVVLQDTSEEVRDEQLNMNVSQLMALVSEKKAQYRRELEEERNRDETLRKGAVEKPSLVDAVRQYFLGWGVGQLSNAIVSLVFYPTQVVTYWLMAQEEDCGWLATAKLLWKANKAGSKSLYDGFSAHLAFTSLSSLFIVAPMYAFKTMFSIAPESRLQVYLQRITAYYMGSFDIIKSKQEDVPGEHYWTKKRYMVHGFRSLAKNTAAYICSDWLSTIAFFPLLTLRNRMAAQGASYLCPFRYTDVFSCFRQILQADGMAGLYRGFGGHLMKLTPDLISLTVVYVVGSIILEFGLDDDEEDGDDFDEDPSLDDDDEETDLTPLINRMEVMEEE